MPTEQLRAELERATEQARDDPGLTVLEVTEPPGTVTFTLTERPLPEAVALASDLDASELYLFTEETGDGDLGRAGVAFVHAGEVHVTYRETTTWNVERALPVVDDPGESTDVAGAGERVRVRTDHHDDEEDAAGTGAGTDAEAPTESTEPTADDGNGRTTTETGVESSPADAVAGDETGTDGTASEASADEDQRRREELATELRTTYGDQLSEGDEWQLEHRLESLSVPQLLDMRETARRQARLDPAEEERLARIVFRDGRFNREYDPEDTELLLNALDIDYDPAAVRMDRVHRIAMNLRTVDE
jgi:hypothetical protein